MAINRLLAAPRRAEPYAAEIFLCLSDAWCAKCLLSNPRAFQTSKDYYFLLKDLDASQDFWVYYCLTASLLMIVGLGLVHLPKSYRAREAGFGMRLVGLGMSAFFWTVVGASFLLANVDAIPSMPVLLIGLATFFYMGRTPVMPDDE